MKINFRCIFLLPSVFFFFLVFTITTATSRSTPSIRINHLIVSITEYPVSAKIQRNKTGHITGFSGASPLVLNWLSLRYKFSYSVLDKNVTTLEDKGPELPGVLSYASRGECDVIVAVIVPSPERLRQIEFVHPWLHTLIGFLIPRPDVLQNNIDAIIKPFQLSVWLALLAAIMTVIVVLSCISFELRKSKQAHKSKSKCNPLLDVLGSAKNVSIYVFGTLFNQGGYLSNRILKIRLVAGAWLLLALVLINVYNGVLISYMTATRRAIPLINSFVDVLTDPSVRLVVDKGLGADATLSTTEKGMYKMGGDKLRAYSKSRCTKTQDCVDLVKSLPARHVYLNSVLSLQTVIREDYLKTRQCKLSIAGAIPYGNQPLYGWGLAKQSPYLEIFNQGTLTLRDMGLTLLWEKQFEPNTQPCMNDDHQIAGKNKNKPLVRLTMVNLTGAFVLLIIGWIVSLLAFLFELMAIYCWK